MPLPHVALRKLPCALITAIVLAGIPARGDELADVLRPLIEKHRGRAANDRSHRRRQKTLAVSKNPWP